MKAHYHRGAIRSSFKTEYEMLDRNEADPMNNLIQRVIMFFLLLVSTVLFGTAEKVHAKTYGGK